MPAMHIQVIFTIVLKKIKVMGATFFNKLLDKQEKWLK